MLWAMEILGFQPALFEFYTPSYGIYWAFLLRQAAKPSAARIVGVFYTPSNIAGCIICQSGYGRDAIPSYRLSVNI